MTPFNGGIAWRKACSGEYPASFEDDFNAFIRNITLHYYHVLLLNQNFKLIFRVKGTKIIVKRTATWKVVC